MVIFKTIVCVIVVVFGGIWLYRILPPAFRAWIKTHVEIKYALYFLGALVGIFLLWLFWDSLMGFFHGKPSTPSKWSVGEISDWCWDNLVLVCLIAFIFMCVALLLGLIPKIGSDLRGWTIKAGAWVLAFFMALVPIGYAVRDAFIGQAICQDVSSREVHSCDVNTARSSSFKPTADSVLGETMRFCHDNGEVASAEVEAVNGTTYYTLRVKKGVVRVSYKLMPAGPDGKCPASLDD